jgi:two-component system sensor histidine kinase RpfC
VDIQTIKKVNPEKEQAVLRFSIAIIVWFYMFFFTSHGAFSTVTIRLILVFIVFSAIILLSTFVYPGMSPARRVVGMVADMSTTSYAMYLSDASGAPLYIILLWTIFGNGIRYGRIYLILATLYGAVNFAVVIHTTPFWTSHAPLSYGLLIGIVALPAFIATLLERLNKAIDRAEEANRAKNRFIANMSHEMRTPLHGIIGTLDLMEGPGRPSEREELTNTIRESARTLLALVNDVLDVSRIEEGGMKIVREDIDLHALLRSVSTIVAPLARTKGLCFRTICSPAVPFRLRGDQSHLEQILLNLLGNAVKFTEEGEVCLKVERIRETSTHATIRLEVSDTGIGISPEAQKHIFQRFAQADESITRRYGGTGLGTTIAKQLVELMGGEMGMRSEPGKGTEFWFTLDMEIRPAEDSPLSGAAVLLPGRILVVSADAGLTETLSDRLSSWHLKPTILSEAVLAFSPLVSAANEGDPFQAAVVVEKDLDMDPFELAKAIRAIRMLRNMKLILVAGGEKEPDPAAIHRQGFDITIAASAGKDHLFNALHFLRTIEGSPAGIPKPEARDLEYGESHPRLRILVAEDNSTNQLVIRKMFERMGHSVRIVENGMEALAGLRTKEFDVAFMDLNMPVMGGLEAVRIHRSEETAGSRLPIIAITADATAGTRAACKEAGIDGCVTKPFDGKKLSEAIASILPMVKRIKVSEAETSFRPEILDELESLGGQGDFVKNLVWMFLRDAETKIKRMELALSSGDIKEFCDLAHAMKGNAGQIGAIGIMEICEKLQHMRGDPSLAGRRELFEEFKEEIASVRKALIRHISRTA